MSLKNVRFEVMKFLEKDVEALIEKYLIPIEKIWQPTDFLPDLTQQDFPDTIKALQDRMAYLPDTVLVSLVGNMITEEALPSYQTFFNLLEGINEDRNVSSLRPWVRWSRLWTAEENRHGDLLNKYLYLSGRVDMKAIEQSIQQLIHNGIDLQTDANPYYGLIYTSFQERATKISHVNTGKLATKAGDNILTKICNTIAGEEALHERAYKFFMSKVLEFDPNGGLMAFMTMMKKKIVMPASLMDFGTAHNNYNSYASITQKIGIYTSLDYANIIDHLVKFWHIDQLQELNDQGKRAQDYLASLAERYYRLAERLQEPEEVQLVWLKH